MAQHSDYARGDRVVVTKWAEEFSGTVTNADDESVFVAYDHSIVEDQLTHDDVRRLER
jgi:hypothetical protein